MSSGVPSDDTRAGRAGDVATRSGLRDDASDEQTEEVLTGRRLESTKAPLDTESAERRAVFPNERLWSVIRDAVERADLEAHLALFVLHSALRLPTQAAATVPWIGDLTRTLTAGQLGPGPLRRAQDVATLGLRIALGQDADRASEFADAARREVARQPLPPAACLRDDERLLLGVAAGIGVVAQGLAPDLLPIFRGREHQGTVRQTCIDLFAEALVGGTATMNADLARRAFRHVTAQSAARPLATDSDRIAVFWLASRLLDADWGPTDTELAALSGLLDDGRRGTQQLLGHETTINTLDAAMLLDALSASPAGQLARRSALDGVLAVIDHFAASAGVLAKRQRGRTPLTIQDEYDVQDFFYALVLPFVPDMVPEDPAPKIAGKSTRLDFTSKAIRIGIELKHVKSASHVASVRDELLLDERTYQEHPYVETVVAFVHDPGGHIARSARTSFEADLSTTVTLAGRSVRYIVRVR